MHTIYVDAPDESLEVREPKDRNGDPESEVEFRYDWQLDPVEPPESDEETSELVVPEVPETHGEYKRICRVTRFPADAAETVHEHEGEHGRWTVVWAKASAGGKS